MPSLRALKEFKSSLLNLGSEIRTMRDLDLPLDDLPLPDNEPENAQAEALVSSPAAPTSEPEPPPPVVEPPPAEPAKEPPPPVEPPKKSPPPVEPQKKSTIIQPKVSPIR